MLLYAALQPAPSRRRSKANPHRDRRAVASRELWEALAARWQILRRHGRDLGGSLILNLLVSRGDDQVVVVRVPLAVGQPGARAGHPGRPGPA